MPIAYSYQRFSSEKQSQGDSLRRQAAMALRYIEEHPKHGLVLDTTLNMVDAGLSAYKGTHLSKGALGVFMAAVETGAVPEGSWLLLESLDRFSRQQVNIAASALLDLINAGINVVTVTNGTIYRVEDFKDGMGGLAQLMGALIAMQGAHAEQVAKSKRISAAWVQKRADISKGVVMSAACPFWLSVNEDRRGFTVIEDRADIVREVYRLRANGSGYTVIASWLNSQGFPTASGRGTKWQVSYVKKLLWQDQPAGAMVTKAGERFDNYYPSIIEEKTYQQVRAMRGRGGEQGLVQGKHWSLSGLIKHQCGKTVIRVNKGDGYVRLTCPDCRTLAKLPQVEAMVSNALFGLQWIAAPTDKGVESQELEDDLVGLELEIEDAWGAWRKTKALEAKSTYERLVAEQVRLKTQIVDMGQSNTEVLATLEETALSGATGGLLSVVRRVAKSIQINHEMNTVIVTTISGRVSSADSKTTQP